MTFKITFTDKSNLTYQAAKFTVVNTANASGLVIEFFDNVSNLVAIFTRVDNVVKVA